MGDILTVRTLYAICGYLSIDRAGREGAPGSGTGVLGPAGDDLDERKGTAAVHSFKER